VQRFSDEGDIEIEEEVFDILKEYPFSGNVRELRNLCERLTLLCQNNLITKETIPYEIKYPTLKNHNSSFENKNLTKIFEEVEKKDILAPLDKAAGNKAKAAELLALPASTLKSKIAKLGM